ncbi:MAG: DUF2284 domain-containing protein [Armatimonadota bacterium]
MSAITDAIRQLAVDAGATHACIATSERFVALEHVLASCADNACGKYGRCWTCPPETGTLEELTAIMQRYSVGVVVQNITPLEDSWDFEGMEKAAHDHNAMLRELGHRARAAFPDHDIVSLGCGGCGFCERCTCPDEPCRSPEEAIASVEGYGLDVKALVESCGLKYINGVNTVSFVGMVLVKV